MKEIAYIRATKNYGGYARHGCMSLIMPNSANALSHNVQIEWFIDEYDDEGSVVKHYPIERQFVLCGSEPLYQISGSTLDEVGKLIEDTVQDLTEQGFHIIDTGAYWYNIKLERDWDAIFRADPNPTYMLYKDIDQEAQTATAEQGSGFLSSARGAGGTKAALLILVLLITFVLFILMAQFRVI